MTLLYSDSGFTREIKTINSQRLWNYNVSNSYLHKLVFFLEAEQAKPFPKNFYKFEKHETGWRFLINLHNNNRFASRKKLSRKQHVAQFCNQFIKLMVTSSKLKKIKFLILSPLFIPRA